MEFEVASRLSQTWGLVALVVLFLGIVIYAVWPSNRKKFEDAARIPLKED
jgi:cytochrome c oxidase cbb3-type subunit 4